MDEMEKKAPTPEEDDFSDIFRVFSPKWQAEREALLAKETPEERALREAREAENQAEWDAAAAQAREQSRRRRKIADALLNEQERTGMQVPTTMAQRFGLIHILLEDDSEWPKIYEVEKDTPEMKHYTEFVEELEKKLESEEKNG